MPQLNPRPGRLRGTRLAKMAPRGSRVRIGARPDFWPPSRGEILLGTVAGTVLGAVAFLISRRVRRRQQEKLRETSQQRYLKGVDVLGAR